MNQPLVSIGLAVYNGAETLRRAMDSLLAQEHAPIELIVSDNASTDGTEAICRDYVRKDPRIRYFRQETNQGGEKNFGFVLRQASGDYFMWAAHDDYWEPKFVSSLVTELEAHPEAGAAMSAVKLMYEDGRPDRIVRLPADENPNGLTPFQCVRAVIRSRGLYYIIYGLFHTEFLRRLFERCPQVIGADMLMICQAALSRPLRHVDNVLYIRHIAPVHHSIRYQNEELGGFYRDPYRMLKYVTTSFPYLLRSTLIPWHRKFLVPLVTLAFFVRFRPLLVEELRESPFARWFSRPFIAVSRRLSSQPRVTQLPFPIETHVKQAWARLGTRGSDGTPLRIAIFGAGKHTQWLQALVQGLGESPRVVAVLDDRADSLTACWDLTPMKPEHFRPTDADAILLSSDTMAATMRTRCRRLYGPDIQLVDLYEGLPPGPYPKRIIMMQ